MRREVLSMATTTKLDMKRELRHLYEPPTHPILVQVPRLRYLMIDGGIPRGGPGPGEDPSFRDAIGALYAVTYTLKFDAKGAGRDFVVMPLEGLFETEGGQGFRPGDRGLTRWTLMILQPPWVTERRAIDAAETLVAKGKLAAMPSLGLETLVEGRAAQVLHVGSYSEESPTIEKLHAFIEEVGLVPHSRHHEIYLSDPNRTAPERLRTVIRQPVRSAP
jgi:hypothetical protein